MQQDWGIIFAFGLYFLALFGIGIFHMKKEQDLAGYVLGGRKVGPWVSAMSAEASDMSGWMLNRYRLGNRNLAELAVCG